MNSLITTDYQGSAISFTQDAWFNATKVAARFGKEASEWLRLASTKEYIAALEESPENAKPGFPRFVKTTRGGDVTLTGTWFHPDLAIAFARWLDVRFGVWCDRQIKVILTAPQSSEDWRSARHISVATNKLQAASVKDRLNSEGREPEARHFMRESKLVNGVIFGKFAGVNRDGLPKVDLDLIAKVEMKNSGLLLSGYQYNERKSILSRFIEEERARLTTKLESPTTPT